MKAYTIETAEIKTSNITPLEGNIVNINGSLNIGEKDTKYSIYLNGKLLDAAQVNNKLDKRGDTMTGHLNMAEGADINAANSSITAKDLTVNETLIVKDINLLNLVNRKADNEDYVSFKESVSSDISKLKNAVAGKLDKNTFETKINLKADKSIVDKKADKNDLDSLQSRTNNLEISSHDNTTKIEALDTTLNNHINDSSHLTLSDKSNIASIQNKADKSDLDALYEIIDNKAEKSDVDNLEKNIDTKISKINTDVYNTEKHINCLSKKVKEHTDDTKNHLHLTSSDISNITSVQNKANKSDLDNLERSILSKAEISSVEELKNTVNVIDSKTNTIESHLSTAENNINILKDKINLTVDDHDFNLLKEQVYKNTSNIKNINSTLTNHIDPKNHLHLTNSDIAAIEDVANKAYQYDVDLLNTYIVEIRCNIEKIWEEIMQKGVTHLVTIPHDDIVNLSYINGNTLYLDVDVNKATEITSEETKVPPTYLIKNYVDELVSNHVGNTEVHINQAERDNWNAKPEKSYVDERDNYVISLIKNTSFLVVPADEHGYPDVPEADRKENIIYLVKDSSSSETENYYIEWIWVKREDEQMNWEKIGSTKVDLTGYATEEYVNNTVTIHASNNTHISSEERITWNNKQDAITPSGNVGNDITTTLSFENGKLVSKASLNSISAINEDTASSTKVPQTQAVVDYIAKVTPDVSNFVKKTGDTMSGDLTMNNASVIVKNGSVASNSIRPQSTNTITFYNVNSTGTDYEQINLSVSATPSIDEKAPIVKIHADKNYSDVIISGESVYSHITNPHMHLTDEQLMVLNAAEKGYFIYKPTEADPDYPGEPYKGVNPKLVLKNNENTGYREAALQVDYDIGSSIEIKKLENGTYSAGISTGNHEKGNKIEVSDDGVLITSSYFGPKVISPNAKTTIMGDTAIGDTTTNYKFTVNGKDIPAHIDNNNIHVTTDEKTIIANAGEHIDNSGIHVVDDEKTALSNITTYIDEKNNANLTSAGNSGGSMCIIEPLSESNDVYIKSLTFITRNNAANAPNDKRMALYCCNASESPALFKANATTQEEKYDLPEGWKYIGISKNTYTNMSASTKYKYEFNDIKVEKGMMLAIMFTKFTDLTENQFAWSTFGATARYVPASDKKGKFYGNDLRAAVSTGKYFTIQYEAEFVTKYGAQPIKQTSIPISLYYDGVYNVSGTNISITPIDIIDKSIKSTILFTPTENVLSKDIFSDDKVDTIVCYEETLLQGKLSIIEIIQANINGTNYITAFITPNVK